MEEYWRRVLASSRCAHLASAAPLAELVEDDIASWGYLREEVWEIARRFRASGRPSGALEEQHTTDQLGVELVEGKAMSDHVHM